MGNGMGNNAEAASALAEVEAALAVKDADALRHFMGSKADADYRWFKPEHVRPGLGLVVALARLSVFTH